MPMIFVPFFRVGRFWRVWVLLALAVGLWALAAGAAWATAQDARADFIEQRFFLDDPTGQLSLADVMARPLVGPTAFKPYTGLVSRGNSNRALWLKLDVAPQAHDALVLLVQPAHLRQVDVYTQSAGGQWVQHRTGTSVAYSQRPRPDVSFALDLQTVPHTSATVYLRLTSPTAMIPSVRVLLPDESVAVDTKLHMLLAAYSAVGLLMSALAVVAWRASGDRIWLLGAAFDVASVTLAWLQMGFAGKYLFPDQPALASALVPFINVFHAGLAYLVFWRLLKALGAPRWAQWFYITPLVASLGVFGLLFSGQVATALLANNLVVLVWSVLGGIFCWVYSFDDKVLTRLYRVLTTALVLYLLFFFLPILKVFAPTQINLYPSMPTNLFTVLVFTAIMARRLQLQLREKAVAEQQRQDAHQRLQVEQALHAETAGLLGMILHEVKNPLTSIRMAASTLSSGRPMGDDDRAKRLTNIQRAIDGIDDVLESCMAVDKLERGQLVLDPQRVDVIEFLREWLATSDDRHRITLAAPDTLHAVVDMRLCLLLVRNLVDNALKYSPDGAPVLCAVVKDEGLIIVRVTNPIGRAGAPDPNAVFTKYYRAPRAMYLPGTGLGLYWVNRVVTLIGGSAQFSAVENLVRFELRIPC